jgi:hypothetical protein
MTSPKTSNAKRARGQILTETGWNKIRTEINKQFPDRLSPIYANELRIPKQAISYIQRQFLKY